MIWVILFVAIFGGMLLWRHMTFLIILWCMCMVMTGVFWVWDLISPFFIMLGMAWSIVFVVVLLFVIMATIGAFLD